MCRFADAGLCILTLAGLCGVRRRHFHWHLGGLPREEILVGRCDADLSSRQPARSLELPLTICTPKLRLCAGVLRRAHWYKGVPGVVAVLARGYCPGVALPKGDWSLAALARPVPHRAGSLAALARPEP